MKTATKVIFASALMLSVVTPGPSNAAYFVDQTKTWALETRAQDVMDKITRHKEGAAQTQVSRERSLEFSSRRESVISNRYTDIVACSSRNVAMMASGSMRSRNSILTCRAATSPSRPTINLAAIGRK
jgi:hypothetical protein